MNPVCIALIVYSIIATIALAILGYCLAVKRHEREIVSSTTSPNRTVRNRRSYETLEEITESRVEPKSQQDERSDRSSTGSSKKLKQPSVTVQLYSSGNDLLAKSAMEELKRKLTFDDINVEYVCVQNMADVNPDQHLLIFCVNSSRLGTDATKAVEGMKSPKTSALLILHHQEKHALPAERSSRILVDQAFKGIGGIYDLAFKQNMGGYYECDMNRTSEKEVVQFVHRVFTSGE